MASRIASVISEEGLFLRESADTSAAKLGLFAFGAKVTITARSGPWRRVESGLGAGYCHGDFLSVDGVINVNQEPAGLDIEVPDADRREPDDRTGRPEPVRFYTVQQDEVLSGIGAMLGIPWPEIAAANGIESPFTVFPNQVLRLPGTPPIPVARVIVRNPLPSDTLVTSSSAQGHHRPYGGTHSVDLDITGGSSPGTAVRFNVEVENGPGVEVRGKVHLIGHACRSGLVADGGRKVQLNLQHRTAGGEWRDSGSWLLYSHLDPVEVVLDDIVMPGQKVGLMGPAGGGEYSSSCADGSHVHVECTRGEWVIDLHERGVDRAILAVAI
jgi:LysM repeat protein